MDRFTLLRIGLRGAGAACADCHVPREWIHKVVREIRANNELYHWLKGIAHSLP